MMWHAGNCYGYEGHDVCEDGDDEESVEDVTTRMIVTMIPTTVYLAIMAMMSLEVSSCF